MARATSPQEAEVAGVLPATPTGSNVAAGLRRGVAAAFVSPAFILIGVFLIFPALWTLYLGLTDYRLLGLQAAAPQFVGIDNYRNGIADPQFLNSLWITLVYVLGSAVIGQTVVGFLLAWAFRNWHSRVRNALEALVIAAWIIPSSVVAFLWLAFLDQHSGTLNALLQTDVPWLFSWPMLSIVVYNTWRGAAFSMLLYGAALNSIPPSHLETAQLAGASSWQQLRDVVLPGIKGHVLTSLLLITLWTFNDFTPYLITAGGPNYATETLPMYVYRTAFSTFQLGYGAAISTIMLAINLVIAVAYLRLARSRTS